MPQGNPRPGEFYLHFKQKLYQVITIAEHSENKEQLVVYQALYGGFKTYARPLAMFTDLVDKKKYPDVKQKYRFQLMERKSDSKPVVKKEPVQPAISAARIPVNQQMPEREKRMPRTSEEKMMEFFDAETMEEKYRILLDMEDDITDRMINNMAVVMDVVIEEGPLYMRFEELKSCVRTLRRYEINRLR